MIMSKDDRGRPSSGEGGKCAGDCNSCSGHEPPEAEQALEGLLSNILELLGHQGHTKGAVVKMFAATAAKGLRDTVLQLDPYMLSFAAGLPIQIAVTLLGREWTEAQVWSWAEAMKTRTAECADESKKKMLMATGSPALTNILEATDFEAVRQAVCEDIDRAAKQMIEGLREMDELKEENNQ